MKYNRALIFSTDDHLYPAGGAEQAFGNITERLPHIEFDLICARLRRGVPKEEVVKNVHIYRIGFGVPKLDAFLLALLGHFVAYRLLRKHSYDFIWSIMASYGAFSAVRVKRKTGLPFLLTLQEGDSFEYIYEKVRYVRTSFNTIFKEANAIQAISQYLLRWGKEMGYSGEYGVVIPNGVAIREFQKEYTVAEVGEMRASFGFDKDAYILMTSSRLEPKNGVKDVIQALTKLPQNVCFIVCGSGSLENSLREQVFRLGLDTRVRFLGFIEPSKLPLLMQASDVFIRPSLSEGLGTAFLEAMASYMPVIGTSVGGIPDFLVEDETGFIVEVENPESIKNAVVRIMELPPQVKKEILDRSEHMVVSKYNWDVIARDMEALFNRFTKV
jgi:glycosyltransferase involved in cell wall biosynthesis